LVPEEAELFARLSARGFEEPEEPFVAMTPPSLLRDTGFRAYIGEVAGAPVATAAAAAFGPAQGIFNVTTLPAYRNRGVAAALTARAIAEGIDLGARWSWLQSTVAGLGLYRRLGFTVLEAWQSWTSDG
jgi:ribosomal protein S18 acetylase RimI-like enzyme